VTRWRAVIRFPRRRPRASGRDVCQNGVSMQARSADTDPEAERFQIELLRRAPVARRVGLARSLSRSVITLARAAIRRTMPGATDQEVGLRFVELHYGRELAEGLRRRLLAAGDR